MLSDLELYSHCGFLRGESAEATHFFFRPRRTTTGRPPSAPLLPRCGFSRYGRYASWSEKNTTRIIATCPPTLYRSGPLSHALAELTPDKCLFTLPISRNAGVSC